MNEKMTKPNNSALLSLRDQITEILAAFDHGEKIGLARRLFGVLEITEKKDFTETIKDVLGRKLTTEEEFKVATLQKALERYPDDPRFDDNNMAKPADSR